MAKERKLGRILGRLGKIALDAVMPISIELDDIRRDERDNEPDYDESVESEARLMFILSRITQRLERIEQDVVSIRRAQERMERSQPPRNRYPRESW